MLALPPIGRERALAGNVTVADESRDVWDTSGIELSENVAFGLSQHVRRAPRVLEPHESMRLAVVGDITARAATHEFLRSE